MTAFTMRLDNNIAKQLDKICKEKGYSKTGLLKTLIRDFIKTQTTLSAKKQGKGISSLVGVVNLGGDAIKDSEDYFS